MFRKSSAILGVVTLLVSLSAMTACDQEKACAASLPILNVQMKGGGGGGGHGGGGGGHAGGGEGAHGDAGAGDHASSGERHPSVPHPDTAPETMPGAHDDPANPGMVTYPGWPGTYPHGVYPSGYTNYYGCHAPASPSPSQS